MRPRTSYKEHLEGIAILRNTLDEWECSTFFDYVSWLEFGSMRFQDFLCAALTANRHGFDPPLPILDGAIGFADELAAQWNLGLKSELKPPEVEFGSSDEEDGLTVIPVYMGTPWHMVPQRKDFVPFSFSLAAFISFCVTSEVSAAVRKHMPSVNSWKRFGYPIKLRNFIDTGLLYLLENGRRAPGWEDLLNQFEYSVNKHLARSFRAYAQLILHAKKSEWQQADDMVLEAAALYLRRARQDREFRLWEGSYNQNKFLTDLRLGLILSVVYGTSREVPAEAKMHVIDCGHAGWASGKH